MTNENGLSDCMSDVYQKFILVIRDILFYLIWGSGGSKDLIKYSNIGNQEMSAKKLSSSLV